MDDQDLENFGIEGKVGEEYQVDEKDPDTKNRIVGEIRGRAAEILGMVVDMVDLVEGSTTASQELRYNIIAELVRDVANAAKQARKK